MARCTANANVWQTPSLSLDEQFTADRTNLTARDCFDAYQDKRAIEGALSTSLYYNDTDCAAQPALGVDDIVGAAEYAQNWINPPQCYRLSAADLSWERKEQEFSQRRAANVMGPAADKFVADPSLGWSDVLDVKGDGAQMRLASGVNMASTKAVSFVPQKFIVDQNLKAATAAPSGSAMSPSVAAMDREYAAMYERSKVGGGAAAYNLPTVG